MFAAAAMVWAAVRAGLDDEVVNRQGWSQFSAFWRAALDPALGADFLRLTVDAASVTVAYAVLGTALSMLIGGSGAIALSRRLWELDQQPSPATLVLTALARIVMAIPRAIHELLWAVLLIQVLGFDPLVAVLAIGIPFGAVSAKVYAEIIDEADPSAFTALRAGGARRATAFTHGLLPTVTPDLVAYTFYRLECAVRSAAILGVIGAGGIGYQLDLSFDSLRYEEIWTLIAALVLLSGLADAWSSAIRRRSLGPLPHDSRQRPGRSPGGRDRFLVGSTLTLAGLVVASWIELDLVVSNLWSPRTRRLTGDFVSELLPPRLGPGGWDELVTASIDTLAMSILALSLAAVGGLGLAVVARRTPRARPVRRASAMLARFFALLFRAIPPVLWAFIVVLVVFPGIWAGAIALGVYNLGVLARLYAEILEDLDPRPRRALEAAGAPAVATWFHATIPIAAPRLASMTLYRWEVLLRETVVVGIVGAGGIGRLIQEHLVARDFAAVAGAIAALIVCTLFVDTLSARLRRGLR